MTVATECPRCRAPVGYFVIRLRLQPTDADQMICWLRDHGEKWWEFVRRFWDVKHAPRPQWWFPPEFVTLAPAGCGKEPELPVCGFCRGEVLRAQTPSLFDDTDEPTPEAPP